MTLGEMLSAVFPNPLPWNYPSRGQFPKEEGIYLVQLKKDDSELLRVKVKLYSTPDVEEWLILSPGSKLEEFPLAGAYAWAGPV